MGNLRAVDGFNPSDFIEVAVDEEGKVIVDESGKELKFIRTKAKETWFRLCFPDGSIRTRRMESADPRVVRYRAAIYKDVADEFPLAIREKQVTVYDGSDFDAKASAAETIAVGRALSSAGFGCEIEAEFGLRVEGETETSKPKKTSKASKIEKAEPVTTEAPKTTETPVKEAEEKDEISEYIDSLVDEVEEKEEKVKEQEEKVTEEEIAEDSSEMSVEEAKAVVLKTTAKANDSLSRYEGKTLGELLEIRDNFAKSLLRKNVQPQVTEEVVKAAKVLAEAL